MYIHSMEALGLYSGEPYMQQVSAVTLRTVSFMNVKGSWQMAQSCELLFCATRKKLFLQMWLTFVLHTVRIAEYWMTWLVVSVLYI